jgi:hypothetical protein
MSLRESTATLIDCDIINSGDNSFSSGDDLLSERGLFSGGVSFFGAALCRAEGTTFAYNGAEGDGISSADRYGAWLAGPETRLYTDEPVNIKDSSRGELLPLDAAPEGPFLTGPPV